MELQRRTLLGGAVAGGLTSVFGLGGLFSGRAAAAEKETRLDEQADYICSAIRNYVPTDVWNDGSQYKVCSFDEDYVWNTELQDWVEGPSIHFGVTDEQGEPMVFTLSEYKNLNPTLDILGLTPYSKSNWDSAKWVDFLANGALVSDNQLNLAEVDREALCDRVYEKLCAEFGNKPRYVPATTIEA